MGVATTLRACADCGSGSMYLVRGLCGRCYQRHKTAGTLNQFDRLAPPGEGVPQIEGISYRQLDHWVRLGYLHPTHGIRAGVPRHWSAEELAVAQTMARLVSAGLPPAVAHRVARGEAEIAPGIKVLVTS